MKQRYVSMDGFVQDLLAFAKGGFDAPEVSRYLADTLIEPDALAPYLRYCDERYTRNLVHKNEDFELLVICWGSGQGAPVHGHEGELCWARVERGRLRFENYRLVAESPIHLERIGEPVEGAVGHLDGPAEIHSVANPSEFQSDAASLHIYSKPYAECDIYDVDGGERRRVQLAYDSIGGERVEGSALSD